jgi:hypothetical protein
MPKAPRARQPDVAERIKLFAEHHIVAIRTSRRNGEIVAVKHAVWGWMEPRAYYALQEIHSFVQRVDPIRFAAFATLVLINKAAIDLGNNVLQGALQRKGLSPEDINTLGIYAFLGPVGVVLQDLLNSIWPTPSQTPTSKDTGLVGWVQAVAAAAIEMELGPAIVSLGAKVVTA